MNRRNAMPGFTIVELLIVIVIIAVLAAITVVAYNGIQARAQNSKISADLAMLKKAVLMARTQKGEVTLLSITGSTGSMWGCEAKSSGTELEKLPKTDDCWTTYIAALTAITDASGVNVKNLVDPWGRPYVIDENEMEGGTCNANDLLAVYPRPFVNNWSATNYVSIPYVTPGCA